MQTPQWYDTSRKLSQAFFSCATSSFRFLNKAAPVCVSFSQSQDTCVVTLWGFLSLRTVFRKVTVVEADICPRNPRIPAISGSSCSLDVHEVVFSARRNDISCTICVGYLDRAARYAPTCGLFMEGTIPLYRQRMSLSARADALVHTKPGILPHGFRTVAEDLASEPPVAEIAPNQEQEVILSSSVKQSCRRNGSSQSRAIHRGAATATSIDDVELPTKDRCFLTTRALANTLSWHLWHLMVSRCFVTFVIMFWQWGLFLLFRLNPPSPGSFWSPPKNVSEDFFVGVGTKQYSPPWGVSNGLPVEHRRPHRPANIQQRSRLNVHKWGFGGLGFRVSDLGLGVRGWGLGGQGWVGQGFVVEGTGAARSKKSFLTFWEQGVGGRGSNEKEEHTATGSPM